MQTILILLGIMVLGSAATLCAAALVFDRFEDDEVPDLFHGAPEGAWPNEGIER